MKNYNLLSHRMILAACTPKPPALNTNPVAAVIQDDPGGERVRRATLRRARVPRQQRQYGRTQRDAAPSGSAHLGHRPIAGLILLPAYQRPLNPQTPPTQRRPPPGHHDPGQTPPSARVCLYVYVVGVTLSLFISQPSDLRKHRRKVAVSRKRKI